MRWIATVGFAAIIRGVIAEVPTPITGTASDNSSPIFGVTIPNNYRRWELIAPAHEARNLYELRAILGNNTAVEAYQNSTISFPDGTILVKLAWKHVPLAQTTGTSGTQQAFVPGHTTTVQVMVKDSSKYPATGGWGFGRFVDGKPVDEAQHKTCFSCHEAGAKDHEFVFTRYAP